QVAAERVAQADAEGVDGHVGGVQLSAVVAGGDAPRGAGELVLAADADRPHVVVHRAQVDVGEVQAAVDAEVVADEVADLAADRPQLDAGVVDFTVGDLTDQGGVGQVLGAFEADGPGGLVRHFGQADEAADAGVAQVAGQVRRAVDAEFVARRIVVIGDAAVQGDGPVLTGRDGDRHVGRPDVGVDVEAAKVGFGVAVAEAGRADRLGQGGGGDEQGGGGRR